MKDFDEDYIRASISHFTPQKIGFTFKKYHYSEDFLREVWGYFDWNSCFFMRHYKFSLNFLREMKDRMEPEYWNEMMCYGTVYTDEEKEFLNKEFGLKFWHLSENFWMK